MRLGFNCLDLDPSYVGGVNTFSLGLLRGLLSTQPAENEITLFVSPHNRFIFSAFEQNQRCRVIEVKNIRRLDRRIIRRISRYLPCPPLVEKLSNFVFRDISQTMSSEVDLIYFPTTVMFPYDFSIPTVVSMHDIQQVHFPEFFSADERLARAIVFKLTAKNATAIQASTQFIQQDLLSHFEALTEDRTFVIQEGVDLNSFQSVASVDVIKKYKLPEKFLFFPGQLWPHKNHLTVLKALKLLRDQRGLDIPLVLTGAKFRAADSIFKFIEVQNMRSVFYLGKVPFEDLQSIYRQAQFLITAVLYESSSLPILEAAASGLPIIASQVGSNVEMSLAFDLNLFEPMNESELADVIQSVWDNGSIKQMQAKKNIDAARAFDWTEIAKRYWLKFEEIVRHAK